MINKTKIALQIHKGAIRLFETGKYSQSRALESSMNMMRETLEEVVKMEASVVSEDS